MELRHLRYFVAIVEEQSITRAAERLRVTQPGVSAQLRQLERELGQPLLDRTPRGLHLTAAGEAFLPYARSALEAAASGAASVSALSDLVTGHLMIGMVSTISSIALDLPELLAGFHAEYSGIDITLSEAASAELLGGLNDGRPDIAIVGLGPAPLPKGIETIELMHEQLVAVIPDCRRGKSLQIHLGDLVDQPLIAPRTGTGLRALLDAAFADAQLRPRIAFESGDPGLLLRLALTGLGAAIVPESVATRHGGGVTAASLIPRIDGRIGLAWSENRSLSPAAQAFITHVRRTIDTTT